MLRPIFLVVVWAFCLAPIRAAYAAPAPTPSASSPAPAPAPTEEKIDSDSPRASLSEFLAACHEHQYAKAAAFLELSPNDNDRGPALARMLKAVLDRHLSLDLETISADSMGRPADTFPPHAEAIGKIPRASGKLDPVRLVRRHRDVGDVWVFSRATVQRVDDWYDELPHRWMLDHLPEWLLKTGPRGVLWWQWIALPLLAAASLVIGKALSRIAVRLLHFFAAKTPASWDDAIVARLGGPLAVVVGVGLSFLALPLLGLYPPAEKFVTGMLRTSIFVAFFWSLLRLVDVVHDVVKLSTWRFTLSSRSLISLGARITKVALGVVATVAVVSELGYPVASLIAGLGIGGLALALASQKTVENLFGAFSIGVDQPFREGDFVKIDDFSGTVEAIGLRSTRVRTLDRTVVSIPNGKLAEMRIESFAPRDRIRLACTLGLVYGTTASQMRLVIAGMEQVLREHPKIFSESMTVRFKELTPSSLDIEIMAWFLTSDSEFQLIRQDVLLQFMEIVEKAGTAFAFPTRTVHLAGNVP